MDEYPKGTVGHKVTPSRVTLDVTVPTRDSVGEARDGLDAASSGALQGRKTGHKGSSYL